MLDFLAGRFEGGRRHTEREVDGTLATYHDDVATLRRLLVDGGYMDREAGVCWRSGGTVAVDGG